MFNVPAVEDFRELETTFKCIQNMQHTRIKTTYSVCYSDEPLNNSPL